ncbi:MAG: polysaccharide export protein [Alphaproteobacteria bacterium]|nr:polysaccharide export protein [Alphaproteobacteria bacterium]
MKTFEKILSLIFTLGLMTACNSATTQKSSVVLENSIGEYVLGTGDKISLIVFGHEDLSGEFTVDSTGSISFPLIKETKVSSLTTKALEDLITEKLSPQYLVDPKVSIEVIDYRDIFILGEVRTPGKYDYIPGLTVQKAIAIAGGYTYRAQERSAELTRQTDQEIRTQVVDDKELLAPGDTIVVKRRWF